MTTSANLFLNDINIWHLKLGHPNSRVLHSVLSQLRVSCSAKNLLFCEACVSGNSHSQSFLLSIAHASAPLKLIHTDLWGPSHEPSKDGFKYYIHFIDDFSRYTWIYPLKTKDQTFGVFLQFKTVVELQLGASIKKIQSDWGGEHRSFVGFLHQNDILFHHLCPYTHQQNGRVERKHHDITEWLLL